MIVQCLLLFYLNIYLSIAVSINKFSPSTLILNEGDNIQLVCLNYDDYQFIYPNDSNNNIETSSINIEKSVDSLSKEAIGVLERRKIVFGDSGWYGCKKLGSISFNNKDPDNFRVYVFITSPRSFFVNENSLRFLLAETSGQITIPCRPTSPNYTVELFHNENPILNSRGVKFDPKEGFLISDLTISDVGQYTCKIKNLNREEEIPFFLQVISKIKRINQPVISSHNRQKNVLKGRDLQLNCSVEIESNILYSLQWITPNINKASDTTEEYLKNSSGVNFYQKIKQLTVRNVSYDDQGNYKCCIRSGFTSKCTNKFITVQDPTYEYLNITSEHHDIRYEKLCNQSIAWIVQFDANPLPRIQWIHPNHLSIQNRLHSNYNVEASTEKVLLQINALSESDSGSHKLILANEVKTVEIFFDLHVVCD